MPLPSGLQVFAEKSADSLIQICLYVALCCFPAAFRILSLSLTFDILATIPHGAGLFVFILFGTLFDSCTCIYISFLRFRKFSTRI